VADAAPAGPEWDAARADLDELEAIYHSDVAPMLRRESHLAAHYGYDFRGEIIDGPSARDLARRWASSRYGTVSIRPRILIEASTSDLA
jgi:hypothetical protein